MWKVSAIITTYKRTWASVNRAIESVADQTRPVDEILLVDDNGYDSEYRKAISSIALADSRIRYVPLDKNGGVAHARNIGVTMATGDIIGFLDDDDEWMPDKTEKLLALFDTYPDAGICFGTGIIRYDDTYEQEETWQHKTFMAHPLFNDMLCNDYVGSASVPFIKRDAFLSVGGFLEKNQPAEEDYELWIRLSSKYGVYGVQEYVFVKHMDNTEHISRNLRKNFLGFRNIYKVNKASYTEKKAKLWIYWNISRFAVKSLDIRGIPYVVKWAVTKFSR